MARSWYIAPALVGLLGEVNAAYPNRDKRSDGGIGDAAHSASASEHNPNSRGSVNAYDFDKDGIDVLKLRDTLINDSRVWYVVFNRTIYSRTHGFHPQPYKGRNDHTKHLHVSLRDGRSYEQDARAWGISKVPGLPVAPPAKPVAGWDGKSFPGAAAFQMDKAHPAVTLLGQRLVAHGFGRYTVGPGPYFGPADKANTAAFQRAQGYVGEGANGYPGPLTWAALMAAPKAKAPKHVPFSGANVRAARESGKKDGNVGIIQKYLIEQGFDLGKSGADGYWGDGTQAAYDKFRWRKGHRGNAYKGSPGNVSQQQLLGDDYKVQ